MKREREEELKSNRGAPSLFFFDLSNISGTTGMLYVLAILSFFGFIFYILINKLFTKAPEFQKTKKQEKVTKKVNSKVASDKKAN